MKKFVFVLIAVSFALLGCADTGNKSLKYATESKVQTQIKEGVTTKDQIQAMFGSPYKTSFTDNGSLIWTYQYDDTTALTPETVGSVLFTFGLAGTKSKGSRNELVVLFDEKNIVRKFNMSNSEIETGTILFTK